MHVMGLVGTPPSGMWGYWAPTHGTAYVRDHLQGKATGCFVDQSKIISEEDAPRHSVLPLDPLPSHILLRICKIPSLYVEKLFGKWND